MPLRKLNDDDMHIYNYYIQQIIAVGLRRGMTVGFYLLKLYFDEYQLMFAITSDLLNLCHCEMCFD